MVSLSDISHLLLRTHLRKQSMSRKPTSTVQMIIVLLDKSLFVYRVRLPHVKICGGPSSVYDQSSYSSYQLVMLRHKMNRARVRLVGDMSKSLECRSSCAVLSGIIQIYSLLCNKFRSYIASRHPFSSSEPASTGCPPGFPSLAGPSRGSSEVMQPLSNQICLVSNARCPPVEDPRQPNGILCKNDCYRSCWI